MTEREGDRNAYYCESCRGYIVTVNRADGVTPFMLACRVRGEPGDPANHCTGRMRSLFYPPAPWPERDDFGHPIPQEPTHEWYRPDAREFRRLAKKARHGRMWEAQAVDHVRQGGLLLRRIDG